MGTDNVSIGGKRSNSVASAKWLIEASEELIPATTAAVDVLAIMLSGMVAYFIYLGEAKENIEIYFGVIILYAILVASFFNNASLYDAHTLYVWPKGLKRLVTSAVSGCVLLIVVAYCLKISEQISRVWFTGFWLGSTFLNVVTHGISNRMLRKCSSHRNLTGSIAVVGASEQAKRWLSQLNDRQMGARVLGVFDDRESRTRESISGYPVLGNSDCLVRMIRGGQVSKVVIALPWYAEERLAAYIHMLREVPVSICIAPDLIGYRFFMLGRGHKATMPLFEVAPKPISGWSAIIKTTEDKILAIIALLILSPLMPLIALAILLESPGPVLFRQQRYGFNKQLFAIYKFRTMYHDKRDENASKLTVRDDPRVTHVGRFLRRYSLDELPQLFNVLNGTMSMIGPRPHAEAANAGGRLYHEVVASYACRHNVKPGITGWAQANGWRGETDTEEKIHKRVEYDLYYLDNWSLWLDIRILCLSIIVAIRGNNAW